MICVKRQAGRYDQYNLNPHTMRSPTALGPVQLQYISCQNHSLVWTTNACNRRLRCLTNQALAAALSRCMLPMFHCRQWNDMHLGYAIKFWAQTTAGGWVEVEVVKLATRNAALVD